jgi:DNA polymerase III sliding clamp (beta) subunit (PCNA family)
LRLRRIASETATRRAGNCDPLHPETECIVPGTATRRTKKLLPDESKKLPVEVLKKSGNLAFHVSEKKIPILRFLDLFFKTRIHFMDK